MLWGGRWEGGSCLGTYVRIKDFKIKKINVEVCIKTKLPLPFKSPSPFPIHIASANNLDLLIKPLYAIFVFLWPKPHRVRRKNSLLVV